MSDDKTNPPKPPPDDDDRTLIIPLSPKAAPAENTDFDDDRTLISRPAPEPPEAEPFDDDRTLVMRPQTEPNQQPDHPQVETSTSDHSDDDRTLIMRPATDPAQTEPQASDSSESGPFSQQDNPPQQQPRADPASDAPAGSQPPLYAPLQTLEIGTIINKMYRVVDSLDQGGMGRVFKGEEMGTGEPVAIKVILPEMAEDIRVGQMFRREARTLRQLHHDAIVRYFAYLPPDADMNLHVLVMGFIQGTKLSDRLKTRGALNQEEVCGLFMRLADGLKNAHDIGVVHRDLSPDNVMLPDDNLDKATLIDFGISRSSKIKDVTIGNEFAGKLKYVSPEQLGAFGGNAEAQSDVYSLGLLMIACLTGQPVPMGDSIIEAVQKRESVPDLSIVPIAFQDLLYKALQPDPALRLQNMGEFVAELRIIRGDEPTGFGTTTSMTKPPARPVQGLQTAPGSRAQTFGSSGEGNDATTATPLPDEPRSNAGMLTAIIALVLLAAFGGWYYFNTPTAPVANANDTGAVTRVEGTISTYLATTASECVYAYTPYNSDGSTIIGFARTLAELTPLTEAWPPDFGPAPRVTHFEVNESQCAALEFAKAFQGSANSNIAITVDQNIVTRAEGVVGTIYGSNGRQNWLALVSPNGRVFSLMNQLEDPTESERRFSFRLPSASPGKYILMATASDAGLVRAGAMQPGTEASVFMPLISRELQGDEAGAVAIAGIEIRP